MRGLSLTGRAVTAAVATLALIGAYLLLTLTPARAGENVFVEVTPSSAQAGTRVNIRASCDNANRDSADVHSEAFGRVMLRPDNGFLTGAVTIPGSTQPGDYPVNLRCDNGNTASTTLTVVNMEQPTKGPATGGGGMADRGTDSLLVIGGVTIVAAAVGFGMLSSRRGRAGARP